MPCLPLLRFPAFLQLNLYSNSSLRRKIPFVSILSFYHQMILPIDSHKSFDFLLDFSRLFLLSSHHIFFLGYLHSFSADHAILRSSWDIETYS